MVLFLDRVYGIENQDFLLHVLDVGFLPDMRAAASLDTVSCPPSLAPSLPPQRTWLEVLTPLLFVLGLCTYLNPHHHHTDTKQKSEKCRVLVEGG
jgi:hypothetical protein